MLPGTVLVEELKAVEEVAPGGAQRPGEEAARVAEVAAGNLGESLRQRVGVVDVGRSCRGEVALVREIGTLEVLDALDQLRDQEVQIGVALAVRVAAQVERDAVEGGEEVGPVVEVEAAQEVLVRLPGAAVLRDHQARNELQHLARAQDGPVLDQLAGDLPRARGLGRPDAALVVAADVDLLDVLLGPLRGPRIGRLARRFVRARETGDEQRGERATACKPRERLVRVPRHCFPGMRRPMDSPVAVQQYLLRRLHRKTESGPSGGRPEL